MDFQNTQRGAKFLDVTMPALIDRLDSLCKILARKRFQQLIPISELDYALKHGCLFVSMIGDDQCIVEEVM